MLKKGIFPFDNTAVQLQEIRNSFGPGSHNSAKEKETPKNPRSKPTSSESFTNLNKNSPEKSLNMNTSIHGQIKNKPIEEVDEEHVFLMQPTTSTSSRFHKSPFLDQTSNPDSKGFDLPLDADFLASLSIDQLVKFSNLRKRVTIEYNEIENIADEILNSEFSKSLNGLQYNTFMLALKKYLNKKIPNSLTHENPFRSIYKSLEDLKHLIKLQPIGEEFNQQRMSDSFDPKTPSIFSIHSGRPSPRNKDNPAFTEQMKPAGDRLRLNSLPQGDGDRNPFFDSEAKNEAEEEVKVPKILIPIPTSLFQRVKAPEVTMPPEYYYNNYLNYYQNQAQYPTQINPYTGEYEYVDPYRVTLGSHEGEHKAPAGGVSLFGNSNNSSPNTSGFLPQQPQGLPPNYYLTSNGQVVHMNPHQLAFYQNQANQGTGEGMEVTNSMDKSPVFGETGQNFPTGELLNSGMSFAGNLQESRGMGQHLLGSFGPQTHPGAPNPLPGPSKFGPMPPNIMGVPQNFVGGPPMPPNLLGGPPMPPNFLGGPPMPPNFLGGPPMPPNLLGGPPMPPNLLGGPPMPPNLLGGPPMPPNLLGGPPMPPNIFGGPPMPPNLLGGPPGPPNLLGGPPGPPNLLGGPKLPGLPGLGPPKLGGLPGLPGKTATVQNLGPKSKTKPLFWETLPSQQFGNSIWTE